MKKLLFASLAVAACIALTPSAHASTLLGSQVTATVNYPTFGNAASSSDTQTVTSAIEFPSGSLQLLPSFGGSYIIGVDIDVRASSIDLAYTQSAGALGASFNGYVFDFGPSAPVITGVSLDPLSSFAPAQIGLSFGPHEIAINVAGLGIASSSQILVDASFAPSSASAPEPQQYFMVPAGLGLLALVARHKTRHAIR